MHNHAKHMGFKAAAQNIEKRGNVTKAEADAILANASRHASAKAKRANPNLKHVKGK